MSKKILYICPRYPLPANSGEDHCFEGHIKELNESRLSNCMTIFLSNFKNIDLPSFKYNNLNYKIFNSKFGNLENKKIIKKILYTVFTLFSKHPFAYDRISTDAFKENIINLAPNIIVADSILSFAILPKNKKYKLIYISHNIEKKLCKDTVKLSKNLFIKFYNYLNAQKVTNIEKNILNLSDKIVCISTSDYNYFKSLYPNKVEFLPHKIEIQNDKWQGENEKSLFFCGPLHFAPNKDSVQWIAEKLAPILSKDIKIKIAGKGTDNVPVEWKKDNIDFLGFVSKEELLDLYRNSSAFLCPIIYGSGVKIKVTEALGFGTPIIATKEALEGLDYIDIKPLIDRNDLEKTKENIENLLNDKEKLQYYSNDLIKQITQYQKDNNNSLEKIIGDCLND